MLLLGGRFHAATFLRRAVCVPAHRGCRSSYSILIITLVLVLAVGAPASAADQAGARAPADPQEQQADAKEPPTPTHTGIRALVGDLGEDIKHLPEMQNVYVAAIGGGLALAVHPADASVNAHLKSQSDAADDWWAPGKYVGGTPAQIAMSMGTYTFGRWRASPTKVAHLGMDLVQAQILTFGSFRHRPNAYMPIDITISQACRQHIPRCPPVIGGVRLRAFRCSISRHIRWMDRERQPPQIAAASTFCISGKCLMSSPRLPAERTEYPYGSAWRFLGVRLLLLWVRGRPRAGLIRRRRRRSTASARTR